ncbi:HAD family hydrolase [Borrelia miyamotoi]|uniref:phosphoglycolate phosphatase n=1 Tax=Borrelia miyamotoi TaxID=47466 RepID=A0AAQ2WVZ4_9SPIR|nr:HAD-IA family hydrolase [Borrelia miyamotoi]AGT27619.1 phosphoglycolate phosphatase [Borrelia miyamotoi LB-2001]AJA58786.1 phosphoglycolate phosphatase [Borrelia miyamotoi]AOW95870.1 phosphoglycolate phosphatase [Borrelia miyamotoi]QTL83761.1 HAD family hydrolase [Borrelia miyamotoi]WAZ84932.1 HAD family hydrolase [Borrelia miyamotoi]
MKIKACIFDMDGTLINSIIDIAVSMNLALKKLGYKEIKTDEFKTLVGRGYSKLVENTLEYLKIKLNNKHLKDNLYQEFVKAYNQNLYSQTRAYDGIPELLSTLNSLNIPIGILSNKNHEELLIIARDIFQDINFFEIRGYSSRFEAKPDPANALDMIIELNLMPEEIAYIGDSDIDMMTAQNVGFLPIGVSWGFRTIDELKKNGAKYILNSPSELLDIIK